MGNTFSKDGFITKAIELMIPGGEFLTAPFHPASGNTARSIVSTVGASFTLGSFLTSSNSIATEFGVEQQLEFAGIQDRGADEKEEVKEGKSLKSEACLSAFNRSLVKYCNSKEKFWLESW